MSLRFSIALFVAVIIPLVVLVWWEVSRARRGPRINANAFRRHLNAESDAARNPPAKETRRGFDW